MTEQEQRALTAALTVMAREQAGAHHYQKQRQARSGRGGYHGARPLEFDESGFPIRQDNSSMIERVVRLISPV